MYLFACRNTFGTPTATRNANYSTESMCTYRISVQMNKAKKADKQIEKKQQKTSKFLE